MKVSKIIPASNARNLERDKERVNTLRVVSRIPTDNRGLRTICEAMRAIAVFVGADPEIMLVE